MSMFVFMCCVFCRNGFVKAESVMKLRKQLQESGCSPSFTTDEKGIEDK